MKTYGNVNFLQTNKQLNRQTDGQTNGQAKNYKPTMYQCEAIKKSFSLKDIPLVAISTIYPSLLNSLQYDKILAWSTLKALNFAGKKLKAAEVAKCVPGSIVNNVGKRRKCWLSECRFPTMFSKVSVSWLLKVTILC